MQTEGNQAVAVRPIIIATWVGCLLVAAAPWLTGGREPVAMVVSAFALMLGSFLAWRQRSVAVPARGLAWWAYLGLLGWGGLSLLWSVNRYSTASWLLGWLLAGLAFRLATVVAADPRGRCWLVGGYLASAAMFVVVGIGMYLFGDYDRLTSVVYWPNPAAAYIMPAIFVVLGRLWRASDRPQTAGWGSLVTLYGTGFWLTGSRAALAVFGFIMLLFTLVHRRTDHFWTKFVFSILAVAIMSTMLVWLGAWLGYHQATGTLGNRITEVATGQSQSGRDRLKYLQDSLEMWFDRPLVGSGAGTYGDLHPQYQQSVVSAATDAHNVYLQVLAELGLVGAVLLASLLLGLLLGLVRGLLSRPELVPAAIGLVALLVHFGLDIDARYPALLGLAGVLAGLVVVPMRPGALPRPAGWKWPLLSLVAVWPAVVLYQSDVSAQRGKVAQADEDYAAAAAYYDQAGAGWIANPDWLSAAGINRLALAARGEVEPSVHDEYAAALESAQRAQRADAHDAQHWQLEGRIQAARPAEYAGAAEAAFRRALALDPLNHPEYALDLARLQLRVGNAGDARRTAEHMLARYPPEVVANRQADPALRGNLANLAALVGNLDLSEGLMPAARRRARQALDWQPDNLAGRALMHQLDIRETLPTP